MRIKAFKMSILKREFLITSIIIKKNNVEHFLGANARNNKVERLLTSALKY